MTTETTTEASSPGRFALDESKAAEWLAQYMADQEIRPEWSPSDDYDGDNIGGMTYEANGQGIITAPDGMTVEYEYTTDGDGGGYRWLLYTGQDYRSLRIASPYQRAWRIGEYDAYGADAALLVLANAVEWANNLLDDLAAYVAAQRPHVWVLRWSDRHNADETSVHTTYAAASAALVAVARQSDDVPDTLDDEHAVSAWCDRGASLDRDWDITTHAIEA